MKHFIGIDPGIEGAVAVIREHSGQTGSGERFEKIGMLQDLEVMDTPTFQVGERGKGRKLRHDLVAMQNLLKAYRQEDDNGLDPPYIFAFIEQSQAFPKMSKAASFKLGYSFGLWEMALTVFAIPYETVRPENWKKVMLLGRPKGKDASRQKVQQLWPAERHLFEKKKDDGRADAVLLAEYGRIIKRPC